VGADDRSANRQSHAQARRFGRVERIKNLADQIRVNSRTVIGDLDDRHVVLGGTSDLYLSLTGHG